MKIDSFERRSSEGLPHGCKHARVRSGRTEPDSRANRVHGIARVRAYDSHERNN